MEIVNEKGLKDFFKNFKFIGAGNEAICFLLPNNQVFKLYYDKFIAKKTFNNLKDLIAIKNDTYIFPTDLLVYKNQPIGSLSTYIKGYKLNKMSKSSKPIDFLMYYEELVINTKMISDLSILLGDVKPDNIKFDSGFKFIDTSMCKVSLNYTKEELFRKNMANMNKSIIYAIFKVRIDEILSFADSNLNTLYGKAAYGDYKAFISFLSVFENMTINEIRNNIQYDRQENSYFKSYFLN